jgi:hypothetical protein
MGKRLLLLGVCLSVSSVAWPARAQVPPDFIPPPPPPPPPTPPFDGFPPPTTQVEVPTHLSIGNQQFDGSVRGLRAYLETTKATDPKLYAQLAPDLESLEARQTNAMTALAVGAVAGMAAGIFAIMGRSDCPLPAVTDPDFAAKSAAWGACNEDNMQHLMIFGLMGFGAVTAGAIAAWASAPKRSDIMDFVNKHNRLSPDPLHFELGYDPTHQYAFAGASVFF